MTATNAKNPTDKAALLLRPTNPLDKFSEMISSVLLTDEVSFLGEVVFVLVVVFAFSGRLNSLIKF